MIKQYLYKLLILCSIVFFGINGFTGCKSKKHIVKTEEPVINDTVSGRCRLVHKTAKILTKYIKENSFDYSWIYAKANVEVKIDSEENSLDIRIRGKKDSAILITIDYLSLVPVAKLLITRDSVKMRIDIKKQYFIGDFNYINELLNADLDFDMIQAVLFGNSAEFYDDDETKLKPVTDRQNCHYLLSTERKRRLRKISQGGEIKKSLQTMTLNPDNYKILKNEFIDVSTNRMFQAVYESFTMKDSVYAPHRVNIDIVAEKKINLKIDYVRIEKNQPQKLSLNIPAKYEPIPVKKPK
jgi:hypothetical protein